MSLSKFNPRTLILILIILLTGVIRVLSNQSPHLSPLANFSPIGSMALFAGAYFNKQWKALSFPLLTLFVSDLILSATVFKQYSHGLLYGGWYWIYGAFALMTIVGRGIIKQINISNVLVATLVSTLIHWIVSDFGVWLDGTLYAKNLSGFLTCLTAAIPFELSFLAGTITYCAVLFGLFEWMQRKYGILKAA